MKTLIAQDGSQKTELTTESTMSHYGIPVLRVTNEVGVNDYGPGQLIQGWPNMNAGEYVHELDEMFGIDGANVFLSQLKSS